MADVKILEKARTSLLQDDDLIFINQNNALRQVPATVLAEKIGGIVPAATEKKAGLMTAQDKTTLALLKEHHNGGIIPAYKLDYAGRTAAGVAADLLTYIKDIPGGATRKINLGVGNVSAFVGYWNNNDDTTVLLAGEWSTLDIIGVCRDDEKMYAKLRLTNCNNNRTYETTLTASVFSPWAEMVNSENIKNYTKDFVKNKAGATCFYTNGVYVVPDDIEAIYVSGCAGGGGGSFCGGGGGGESVSRKKITVTPGERINITIGTGGAAAYSSVVNPGTNLKNAGDGGNTIFGKYFTLTGGKGIRYNSSAKETQMPLAGGNGATNGTYTAIMRYNSSSSTYWVGGNGGNSLFGKGGSGGTWSVYCALNNTSSTYMHGSDGIGYGAGGGGCGLRWNGSSNYATGAGSGTNGFIMIEVI